MAIILKSPTPINPKYLLHGFEKQTLANVERYITEALKSYEDSILDAEEKMEAIEQRLYQSLLDSAAEFVPQILQNAKILAQLDCYLAFAEEARKYNYSKPIIKVDTGTTDPRW